jgi:putative serine protease PepD
MRIVVASIVGALIVGAAAGVAGYAVVSNDSGTTTVVRQVSVGPSAAATSSSNLLSVGEIYERTHKGVVEITINSTESTPFGSQNQQAQGSGFVYDDKGDVITNAHVVSGASTIRVKFSDGSTHKATLVGADESTDLAVIDVDAPASLLEPLQLGDSDSVRVGDGVVAIGSPFGLDQTVTSGIVSALHRQMTSPNNFTIDDSIQTDAAINHGNSGGPLLDLHGRVIGVNSQIESDSGGNDGVGFAVPSNTVKSVVSQLVKTGNVQHAYLGVSVETIPPGAAATLGLPAGAEVSDVQPDTPAAKAGLRPGTGSRTVDGQAYSTGGDVIVAIDGKKIADADALRSRIAAHKPGDKIAIEYVRDGKRHTASVTLGSRP